MYRLLSVFLSLLLVLPSFAGPTRRENMSEWAKGFKAGDAVTLKLVDHTKIKGTLVTVGEAGITVIDHKRPDKGTLAIQYDEIQSLEKKTPVWVWACLAAIGVIIAAVCAVYSGAALS
jgi:hypothetical protein